MIHVGWLVGVCMTKNTADHIYSRSSDTDMSDEGKHQEPCDQLATPSLSALDNQLSSGVSSRSTDGSHSESLPFTDTDMSDEEKHQETCDQFATPSGSALDNQSSHVVSSRSTEGSHSESLPLTDKDMSDEEKHQEPCYQHATPSVSALDSQQSRMVSFRSTERSNSRSLPLTGSAEFETLNSGETTADCWKRCRKYSDHSRFIPASDFTLNDLPTDCSDTRVYNCIHLMSELTVKLTVRTARLENKYSSSPNVDLSHCLRKPVFSSEREKKQKNKGASDVTRVCTGFLSYFDIREWVSMFEDSGIWKQRSVLYDAQATDRHVFSESECDFDLEIIKERMLEKLSNQPEMSEFVRNVGDELFRYICLLAWPTAQSNTRELTIHLFLQILVALIEQYSETGQLGEITKCSQEVIEQMAIFNSISGELANSSGEFVNPVNEGGFSVRNSTNGNSDTASRNADVCSSTVLDIEPYITSEYTSKNIPIDSSITMLNNPTINMLATPTINTLDDQMLNMLADPGTNLQGDSAINMLDDPPSNLLDDSAINMADDPRINIVVELTINRLDEHTVIMLDGPKVPDATTYNMIDDHTSNVSRDQTINILDDSITNTSDDPTASTSNEQLTDTSVNATTSTSDEQITNTSDEQMTDTSGNARTNTSDNARTNTSDEEMTDTSVTPTTNTSDEQMTDTSDNARTNTSGNARTNTSGNARTNMSDNARTNMSDEQMTNTSDNARTNTSDEQMTDTSDEQMTDMSDEQMTDTSDEQMTETDEQLSDTSVTPTTNTSNEQMTNTSGDARTNTPDDPTNGSIQDSSNSSSFTKLGITCVYPCPCPECQQIPPSRPYGYVFRVLTDRRAIADHEEAANTVVDLEFGDEIKHLYGQTIQQVSARCDLQYLMCVTHDDDLADWIQEKCVSFENTYKRLRTKLSRPIAVICSYPHGHEKMISVGQWTARYSHPCGQTPPLAYVSYEYTTPTCPGSTGAPALILGQMDNDPHIPNEIQSHYGNLSPDRNNSGIGLAIDVWRADIVSAAPAMTLELEGDFVSAAPAMTLELEGEIVSSAPAMTLELEGDIVSSAPALIRELEGDIVSSAPALIRELEGDIVSSAPALIRELEGDRECSTSLDP